MQECTCEGEFVWACGPECTCFHHTERMVSRNIMIDEEKHARLRAISKKMRIPMAVLIREGLDRVLELAEKQQDSIERAQRA